MGDPNRLAFEMVRSDEDRVRYLNNAGMICCDRHRWQYDDRTDLGPFAWARIETKEET